jgi:hypothetical protein
MDPQWHFSKKHQITSLIFTRLTGNSSSQNLFFQFYQTFLILPGAANFYEIFLFFNQYLNFLTFFKKLYPNSKWKEFSSYYNWTENSTSLPSKKSISNKSSQTNSSTKLIQSIEMNGVTPQSPKTNSKAPQIPNLNYLDFK